VTTSRLERGMWTTPEKRGGIHRAGVPRSARVASMHHVCQSNLIKPGL
jgi:hypothetical protein